MLYRSLYFLFHDEQSVREVIRDLEELFSLDDRQLHAIIESGHQLKELPGATLHSKTPEAMRREKNLFYLSAALFASSLIALILSLLAGLWYLAALFASLVVASQLSGYLFGNRIPNAQIDRFRSGLSQGDILLQVDVAPGQVKMIRDYLAERNPESTTEVSNWHVGTIGL